jgi:hypothetical protein
VNEVQIAIIGTSLESFFARVNRFFEFFLEGWRSLVLRVICVCEYFAFTQLQDNMKKASAAPGWGSLCFSPWEQSEAWGEASRARGGLSF